MLLVNDLVDNFFTNFINKSFIPNTKKIFLDLIDWCKKNNAFLGVTGSSQYRNKLQSNDIDLIILINSHNKSQLSATTCPPYFNETNWEIFKKLYNSGEIDLFGSICKREKKIKIEIYPHEIFLRILSLNQFMIRRLRESPRKSKKIICKGTDGSFKSLDLTPRIIDECVFSEILSVEWDKQILYVGIHLEKLLLSQMIFGDQVYFSMQKEKCYSLIENSIESVSSDVCPYEGEYEKIFFSHKKIPNNLVIKIRNILCRNSSN